MSIWPNSKMSTLYYSNESSSEDYPCIVEINENSIKVKYDADEFVEYQGENHGDGHFQLKAPSIDGEATLHMSKDSEVLEGSWVEGSYRGMWRIALG